MVNHQTASRRRSYSTLITTGIDLSRWLLTPSIRATAACMWKKLFTRVGLGLIGAVALLLLVASFQPADYKVERSISIQARPYSVWEFVSDLPHIQHWSPWDDADPTIKISFAGETGKVGSSMSWDGKSAGAGTQTMTALDMPSRVDMHLHFVRPFDDHADTQFLITPEGTGSKLTWVMRGHKNLISKVMCMFMDMDKMMGAEFEKGLAEVKTLSEAEERRVAPRLSPELPKS